MFWFFYVADKLCFAMLKIKYFYHTEKESNIYDPLNAIEIPRNILFIDMF